MWGNIVGGVTDMIGTLGSAAIGAGGGGGGSDTPIGNVDVAGDYQGTSWANSKLNPKNQ